MWSESTSRDHPRVCGEKRFLLILHSRSGGSPPRVRGKARFRLHCPRGAAITPACAGKSKLLIVHGQQLRDHPRVCGEKDAAFPAFSTYWGSPPRVRGKGLAAAAAVHAHGITPACAGKSSSSISLMMFIKDHPRVCGEKSGRVRPWRKHKGSPPRVRGKG